MKRGPFYVKHFLTFTTVSVKLKTRARKFEVCRLVRKFLFPKRTSGYPVLKKERKTDVNYLKIQVNLDFFKANGRKLISKNLKILAASIYLRVLLLKLIFVMEIFIY